MRTTKKPKMKIVKQIGVLLESRDLALLDLLRQDAGGFGRGPFLRKLLRAAKNRRSK